MTHCKNRKGEHQRRYKKHWAEIQESNKKYYLAHKDEIDKYRLEYQKAYRQLNNLKVNARNWAYKNILIPNRELCFICKKELATQRHHEDYSKPDQVKFACLKCHNILKRQKDG